MTKYTVTAFDSSNGCRATLSKEMSLTCARYFEKTVTRNMALLIPAYQGMSDIQIEEVKS